MITAWAVPALLLTALGVSLNSRSETPRTDFARPPGSGHGEMDKVIAVDIPSGEYEQFRYAFSQGMYTDAGVFAGRLHVSAEPAVRLVPKQAPVINLTLTARSTLLEDQTLSGALSYLDSAHETVTSAFQSVLTASAKRFWEVTE